MEKIHNIDLLVKTKWEAIRRSKHAKIAWPSKNHNMRGIRQLKQLLEDYCNERKNKHPPRLYKSLLTSLSFDIEKSYDENINQFEQTMSEYKLAEKEREKLFKEIKQAIFLSYFCGTGESPLMGGTTRGKWLELEINLTFPSEVILKHVERMIQIWQLSFQRFGINIEQKENTRTIRVDPDEKGKKDKQNIRGEKGNKKIDEIYKVYDLRKGQPRKTFKAIAKMLWPKEYQQEEGEYDFPDKKPTVQRAQDYFNKANEWIKACNSK